MLFGHQILTKILLRFYLPLTTDNPVIFVTAFSFLWYPKFPTSPVTTQPLVRLFIPGSRPALKNTELLYNAKVAYNCFGFHPIYYFAVLWKCCSCLCYYRARLQGKMWEIEVKKAQIPSSICCWIRNSLHEGLSFGAIILCLMYTTQAWLLDAAATAIWFFIIAWEAFT
jgi:hypothetical protein